MISITVNARELDQFRGELTSFAGKTYNHNLRWIRKLTQYTVTRMKFYVPNSARSTGNLRSNIDSKYNLSATDMSGEAFVNASVKYQFAAEYGMRRKFNIYGRPTMAIKPENWMKAWFVTDYATRPVKLGTTNGYYIFRKVKRGAYSGTFFTQRAFIDLVKYFDSQSNYMSQQLLHGLTLSFGTGRE